MLLTTKPIRADRQHKIYATGRPWDLMLAGSWWEIFGRGVGVSFSQGKCPGVFPGVKCLQDFFGGGVFHRDMFGECPGAVVQGWCPYPHTGLQVSTYHGYDLGHPG